MRLTSLVRPLWTVGTLRGASKRTVVITGSPRSGTTWLLEAIERSTGARRIYEPFLPTGQPVEQSNFGLGLRPYLTPDTDHPELQQYLSALFDGRRVDTRQATGAHRYKRKELARRLALAPCTVVKCCRAQRLLPWMTRRFDIRVVLLMRHPLAVVASALHHPLWHGPRAQIEHPALSSLLERDFPELVSYARSLSQFDEKLAATWAFDYLVPLSRWGELENVLLVTYEDLVRSRRATLGAVLRHLELRSRVGFEDPEPSPSATTLPDSNVARGDDPLTTWRHTLSEAAVARILTVVRNFGVKIYGTGFLPDMDALRAWVGHPPMRA